MKMKLHKKGTRLIGLCLMMALASAQVTQAQVKGISYTLAPSGEYVFWNKNTGISDGFLVGGQLGFGFGEFVELRATYLQSLNLTRNFSSLSTPALQNALLDTINVGVQRWGGDFKINLARGGVVPYLTLGTGVQTLSPDDLTAFKNIYVSAGGGLQFSAGDRYTFGVQAVNTSFNDSPVRSLTSAAERTANELALADYPNELLRNWSVRASLIFYLGGRKPGDLSELDKDYLANFSRGISLPIEVTAGQLNFDKSLPFANTKFIGVSSGFNFGPYVGIRGFYWRGMEDGYFSTADRLALYGGEGKFKLSNGQGLTPNITVGGGVIDALEGYEVNGISVEMDNKPFVSGGLGLDFPFSRSLKLTAYAKALLTSNDLLENTVDPDELSTSWAYGLSLGLLLGNGRDPVKKIEEASYDAVVMKNMKAEIERSEDLKKSYEEKIDDLNDDIRDARADDDRTRVNELTEERNELRKRIAEIEDIQRQEKDANKEAYDKKDGQLMKMNPTEFRNKLDEAEKQAEREFERNQSQRRYMEELQERLRSIEDKLDQIEKNNEEIRQDFNNSNRNDQRNSSYDSMRNSGRMSGGRQGSANYGDLPQDQLDAMRTERRRAVEMQAAYEKRISKLSAELDSAKAQKNETLEKELTDEKQALEDGIEKIKAAEQAEEEANRSAYRDGDPAAMKLMTDEYKKRIDEIERTNQRYQQRMERSMNQLERRYERQQNQRLGARNDNRQELEAELQALRNELEELRQGQNRQDGVVRIVDEPVETLPEEMEVEQAAGVSSLATSRNFITPEQQAFVGPHAAKDGFFSRLHYNGMSALGGVNFGGATTLNIGFRSHYRYRETNFYLMPETFLGFGTSSTFGLFVNGIYDFKLKNETDFSPYAGVGLGLMKIGSNEFNNTQGVFNIIVGANLFQVAGGRFYVDLSARNLFRNSQISAGYRLPF
ncbi:coiled-coil domain-containing protein [Arundinibacter roseus]|uniref:Outer membrane protein beta-barrel domain-containing protein n=1 Tax=Arundinibacter roseus TaxID=2070510 RepID=A0A4R4K5N3_9BACT|nr:hypothetical protein [Arundinibacter roseus]TDB61826.1 hypothetical protein EZE20_18955 [Arundinibacter roseus]